MNKSDFIWLMNAQVDELSKFIEREEKSKYNPMYYLYYPAKASVVASKSQLKGCIESLKEFVK